MRMQKPKRLLAVLLSVLVVAELVVSVVLGTVAEDSETVPTPTTKTVTKQLIDFSGMDIATNIQETAWPKGIAKMNYADYKYNSNYSVDIAEDSAGEKFLKFNFNQTTNSNNGANIKARAGTNGHIFVTASIPYWYINYLKDIKLDYVYNYNKSGTGNRLSAFYILGVSDGISYSKSTDGNKQHATLAKDASVQTGSDTKAITDLKKFSDAQVSNFTGNTNLPAGTAWTAEDIASQTKLDVVLFFSAPYIQNATDINAGYYFGIKGISVTLEGPEVEIDNVDNEDYVTPGIIDFEEGATLDEIKANTNVKFSNSVSSELSNDAFAGNNAFLFRRRQNIAAGNDYDSYFSMWLQRNVTRSKGITFMAKNINDKEVKLRIWIRVGNDTDTNASKGKYQYIMTLPANMTEYQRVSIYWNNVGLMNFSNGGEWWAGTTSGNAITADELASGIGLNFKNYGAMVAEDPGVLFDEFEYITKQFTEARTTTLVDFSSMDVGTELPENVAIGGNYGGTTEIVENIDGSKSLRLNYDAPAEADTTSEMHHLRSREYFIVSISVPKGSMDDLSEMAVDMTNNRADITAANGQKDPNTALYNIGIADIATGKYGKTPEINDTVNFTGNTVVTKKPVGMRKVGSYQMTAWTGTTDKWVEEDLKNIDTVVLYVSAPDCDGTEGESFQLNSITLVYNEPPRYNEEAAREIVHSEKVQPLTSGKITAKSVVVGSTDPNSAEFSSAIEIQVKDASNTERLVLNNELTEFHRNLTPFYEKETAIFHMFAFAEKDTNFQVALIDKNGAELTTEVVIAAAKTKLYTETSVSVKDIYDAAITADPDLAFDMSDIRAIAILPVVEAPTTLKIAGATILTGDYVSSANDPEKQKTVNLVNFDNCKVGTKGDNLQLPSNVTVSGYGGSKEIVRTADGSNALQVNYDVALENTGGELHQTRQRTNITIQVAVPKGSLEKLNRVHFTLTNNGYTLSEQTKTELKTYLTMAVRYSDSSVFVKQGESAANFSGQKGVATTVSLQVKGGFAGSGGYSVTSWMNKNNCIELLDEHFSNFEYVTLYIAVPDVEGSQIKSGMNFQINSIDLEFEEKPAYNEPLTRLVANGEVRTIETTNKSTLTVTSTKLASNNINYRTFKTYYTLDAKKGNTAPAVVENSLSKFLRNAEPFLDTATFRMYYKTTKATKAQVTLVNTNGERLPFEVKLETSDSDKFSDASVALKDVYEDFLKNNPEDKFSLTDITSIEILPLSSSAVKINVASPGLWSKEAGSSSSVGNYYYALEDDTARVEAYNYNITDDFKVSIEYLNAETEIANNGTRIPEGATVVRMIKVSLRNAKGELAEPAGRFWVSFKLPTDIDLNNLKMYEVFYDGSLVEIKHVVMDANNYISCEDFFSNKIYAILVVPPVKEEIGDDSTDNTTDDSPGYYYEEIIIDGGDGEVVDTPSQETIRKIIRKKKKATANADYTWVWILIAVLGAVLLLATGLVIFLIIRKKRKNGEENVAV